MGATRAGGGTNVLGRVYGIANPENAFRFRAYGGHAVPHQRSESENIIARLLNVAMAAGLEDIDGVFNRNPQDVPVADLVRLAHRCNHAWLFNSGGNAIAIAVAVAGEGRIEMIRPGYDGSADRDTA